MFPGMWSIFDHVTEERSVELGCVSCWNLPGKAEGQHSSMRPLGAIQTWFVILVHQKSKCDLKTTPCANVIPNCLLFPQKGRLCIVAANARRYTMTMPFSFVSGTKKKKKHTQRVSHKLVNWPKTNSDFNEKKVVLSCCFPYVYLKPSWTIFSFYFIHLTL